MEKLELTEGKFVDLYLPLPPSVNDLYELSRYGGKFLKKSVHDYRAAVQDEVQQQCGVLNLDCRIRLQVWLHHKHSGVKWDLDNRLKALCDALEFCSVFENDSQIDELHVIRNPNPSEQSSCVVILSNAEHTAP